MTAVFERGVAKAIDLEFHKSMTEMSPQANRGAAATSPASRPDLSLKRLFRLPTTSDPR
jgi:hypothetical protein